MSMKNFNDTIGNRTRNIPACNAVSQPNALSRTPHVCEPGADENISIYDGGSNWRMGQASYEGTSRTVASHSNKSGKMVRACGMLMTEMHMKLSQKPHRKQGRLEDQSVYGGIILNWRLKT